MCGGIKSP